MILTVTSDALRFPIYIKQSDFKESETEKSMASVFLAGQIRFCDPNDFVSQTPTDYISTTPNDNAMGPEGNGVRMEETEKDSP
jgi:hypothetical protein